MGLLQDYPVLKWCSCCKQEKPLDDFGKSKDRKHGRHPYCKPCKAQKAKELYFRDHELTLQKKHEYVGANKERMAAYKTKWRVLNRDKHNETNRQWAKRNSDLAVAKYKKYQMTKRNRVPCWADTDAIKAFYAEARRLTKSTGVQHHVDHIVPLQSKLVCGLHCEANLQVLPGRVNQSKSNKLLEHL